MRTDEEAPNDSRLSRRESGVLGLLLAQAQVAEAVRRGPAVQLRASGDSSQGALLPFAATIEVNSGDAKSALRSVEKLSQGLGAIFVHNVLQYVVETRQLLGACFAKLSVGGVLAVTTPHQFLYERKLRLPSRRDFRHRRFFTPNTLMAEIEEALDLCAYRVRYLGDCDQGYDYGAAIADAPDGGQDIVVVIEKIAPPQWRDALESDELWAHTPTQPFHLLEIDRNAPAPVETILPDHRGVRRIAVVKLDHRGDFLMAGAAFGLLRQSFPDAEMTLICGSWNVAEAETLGTFDKIIPLDFFPEDDSARQETPPRDLLVKRFAEEMSGESYDLAVDLRLSEDTRVILQAIDARNRAGFDRYDSFPWLTIRLNLPSATEDDRTNVEFLPADRFLTALCRHLGFEIRSDDPIGAQSQTVVWGPYASLRPGHYRFECFIEPLADDFDIRFDIATDSGREILTVGTLRVSRQRRPEIFLDIDRPHATFEFRLYARPGNELQPFRFFGLKYVRSSPARGPHQSEAMALLAHLVAMRLRDAYAVETL
jgi:hypothetical protein